MIRHSVLFKWTCGQHKLKHTKTTLDYIRDGKGCIQHINQCIQNKQEWWQKTHEIKHLLWLVVDSQALHRHYYQTSCNFSSACFRIWSSIKHHLTVSGTNKTAWHFSKTSASRSSSGSVNHLAWVHQTDGMKVWGENHQWGMIHNYCNYMKIIWGMIWSVFIITVIIVINHLWMENHGKSSIMKL